MGPGWNHILGVGKDPPGGPQAGREPLGLKQCPQPLTGMKSPEHLKTSQRPGSTSDQLKPNPWEQGQGIVILELSG